LERKKLVLLKSAKNNNAENEIKQDSTESPIPWAIPVPEIKKSKDIKKLKLMKNVESKKELFFILYCFFITCGVLVISIWSFSIGIVSLCVSSVLGILFIGFWTSIFIKNSTLKVNKFLPYYFAIITQLIIQILLIIGIVVNRNILPRSDYGFNPTGHYAILYQIEFFLVVFGIAMIVNTFLISLHYLIEIKDYYYLICIVSVIVGFFFGGVSWLLSTIM
jgi:hypothetical protein